MSVPKEENVEVLVRQPEQKESVLESFGLNNLSTFTPNRILNSNSNRKTVTVLGRFNQSSVDAILLLEKQAFTEENVSETSNSDSSFFTASTELEKQFINDVYGSYEATPASNINRIKVTIICPATAKHVQKYSQQQIHIIKETATLYEYLTLPHLKQEQFSLDWVYNILDHKKESDRIVFEDPCDINGFILLPDLKWDCKNLETLYLSAIVRRRDLKSLRDLTGDHLPLLRNIYDKGTKAIADTYGLPATQLRIYFHYQPSFYHLHVHFTYLKYDAPGIFCEKSHLLLSVINNLELMSDYYQKATLPFVVLENDSLFEKLEKDTIVKRRKLNTDENGSN